MVLAILCWKISDQFDMVLWQLEKTEILYFSEIYTPVENSTSRKDNDDISLQLSS